MPAKSTRKEGDGEKVEGGKERFKVLLLTSVTKVNESNRG